MLVLLSGRAVAAGLGQDARSCVYPVRLPFAPPAGDVRPAVIERKLLDALQHTSFRVVEPAQVKAVNDRVLNAVGGFVDPTTGVRDVERHHAYRERLASALGHELACDAQVFPSIVPVRATFNVGVASWDGASQQVSSTGRIVLNVLGGQNESGWVSAFSLWLRVLDLAGEDLAFRSGGIEVLVHLAVLHDKDLVPDDQWLTDGGRLDAAIAAALGPGGDALRREAAY